MAYGTYGTQNNPSQSTDWLQQKNSQAQQPFALGGGSAQTRGQAGAYAAPAGNAAQAWSNQVLPPQPGKPTYAEQQAQYAPRQAAQQAQYDALAGGQQKYGTNTVTGYNTPTGQRPSTEGTPAGAYASSPSDSGQGGYGMTTDMGRSQQAYGQYPTSGAGLPYRAPTNSSYNMSYAGGAGRDAAPTPSYGGGQSGGANNGTSPQQGQQQQPNYGQQPPWSDYPNPDGTWHVNPQWGQGGSDIGNSHGQPAYGQQTSGESGPMGGGQQPRYGVGVQGQQQQQGQQQGQQAPQPQQQPFMGPGGAPGFVMPQHGTEWWSAEPNKTGGKNFSTYQLPIDTFMQNQYQYGNDFAEAKRRFDAQFGQSGQAQQFQQDLSTRQQGEAERIARLQADQWAIANNQQNVNDTRNYGLQERGLTNQEYATQQQYGQSQQQINNQASQFDTTQAFNQRQWGDQFGLQSRAQGLNELQNTQQNDLANRNFGLANRGMGLQELANSQQYGLAQQGMNLQELQNKQQYGLQSGQLDLSRLTQQQQNALQTGQLTLAQLTQQQQNQYQTGQLGLGSRGLDLQDWQQRQGVDLQREQMAQQLQMQQAQLKQQQEAAYLSAYGHNQKPNAKWMRQV